MLQHVLSIIASGIGALATFKVDSIEVYDYEEPTIRLRCAHEEHTIELFRAIANEDGYRVIDDIADTVLESHNARWLRGRLTNGKIRVEITGPHTIYRPELG